MLENKTVNFRDDFPGYMGHIPYKKEVIGMTVGSTNNLIKKTLTTEPPKEEIIKPIKYDDYTFYNKDYFTENFYRDYKLEEDQVFSNRSKDAVTWVKGSTYKLYPQHIPGYKAHVPGIYGANIHGLGYSKSTAIAIKGDYPNSVNVNNKERYKTNNNLNYTKPPSGSSKNSI
jgi:hypothetical protein